MGRIISYGEKTGYNDGDYLLMDNAESGAKRIRADRVGPRVDPQPTEGSSNVPSSGGTWRMINDAINPETINSSVVEWLNDHPEATTTVQDGAITEDKLNARLKLLTNVDLNGVTYFENIALPVVQSYVEAVTYFNGYYYVACRDYSASPNTCFVAKYDASYNFIDTIYTSPTYGIANNIFNDGERIYIDYDSGYHVSFNTSISDDFAVQNTAIRNLAYWNNTLYGIAINTNNVTVYTVASDFITTEEVFSVITQRYTLQSASIIDGILYIPTTKGLFKFIDMQAQRIIAEIPYHDSKEIENFFLDKDGTVKCGGHFYGLNGIFNIGTFDGGVNGAKMQYTAVDASSGDYRLLLDEGYGFYKISNGTDMGLPADTGDLLLFEDARLFVSKTSNTIYAYSNNAWNLIGFLSGKRAAIKVNNNYILFDVGTDGRLTIRCDYLPITQAVTEVNVDLSSLYSALGFADNQSFTIYITGSTNSGNIAASASEVYVAQIYIRKTQTNIYTRNVTQNSTANINAKFSFFETLR